jgi:hypothetical protein
MVELENRLVELLGVPVDLSPAKTLKPTVWERVEREAVLPFRVPSLSSSQSPIRVTSALNAGSPRTGLKMGSYFSSTMRLDRSPMAFSR